MKSSAGTVFRLIAAILLCLFLTVGCKEKKGEGEAGAVQGGTNEPFSFASLPEVIATVNGKDIPRSDLEKIFNMLSNQAKMTGQEKSSQEIVEIGVRELINMELLRQESVRRKIDPPADEVEAQVKQLEASFPDAAAFEKVLKEKGLTMEEIRKNVAQQIAVQKMLEEEVEAKVKVSADDVEKFYKGNPDFFKTEESVKASHILVKVEETADEKTVAEAKKKIDELLARLKKGEDFAEVAKKHSEGPSAPNGGDLDYFSRGQMVPPFEEAAFALKKGGMSGIVRTKFGFHIIKVYDRKPAGVTPLKEVEESIRTYLSKVEGEKVFNEYVEKLRDSASIAKKI